MTTPILTAAPGVGGSYAYNPDTGLMELIEFTDDPHQARPPGFEAAAPVSAAPEPAPSKPVKAAVKSDQPPQE